MAGFVPSYSFDRVVIVTADLRFGGIHRISSTLFVFFRLYLPTHFSLQSKLYAKCLPFYPNIREFSSSVSLLGGIFMVYPELNHF